MFPIYILLFCSSPGFVSVDFASASGTVLSTSIFSVSGAFFALVFAHVNKTARPTLIVAPNNLDICVANADELLGLMFRDVFSLLYADMSSGGQCWFPLPVYHE